MSVEAQQTEPAKRTRLFTERSSRLSSIRDLHAVRSRNGGLFASANVLFGEAEFGRDQAEAAEDLLGVDREQQTIEGVIQTLAQLQGRALQGRQIDEDPFAFLQRVQQYVRSEQEDGKNHHEHRRRDINDDRPLSVEGELILRTLSAKWGGTEDKVTYYGSVDATPLFVNLTASYLLKHPERKDRLLASRFRDVNGKESSVEQSLLKGIVWIEEKLAVSDIGLIEFKRSNPQGLLNPVWMDSETSYVHPDGTMANHQRPIAPIEVQGIAYDALRNVSALYGQDEKRENEVTRWSTTARTLQKSILERYWMPDAQYFAMGIDRDDGGNPRQIKLLSSNAALLLNTSLFDALPDQERKKYVSGIVRAIYSDHFMTDAGVRCASVTHADIVTFQDETGNVVNNSAQYHLEKVSWPKQSFDVAKGFERQGFYRLNEQTENRIVNATNIAQAHFEFFYVDTHGRVNYDPYHSRPSNMPFSSLENITGTNLPEETQTWTITAVRAIKAKRGRRTQPIRDRNSWQYRLEEELLPTLPHVNIFKTQKEIEQVQPTEPPFAITIFHQGLSGLSLLKRTA